MLTICCNFRLKQPKNNWSLTAGRAVGIDSLAPGRFCQTLKNKGCSFPWFGKNAARRSQALGNATAPMQPHADMTAAARTNVRWLICTLLFFATTMMYVDRAVLGFLKKMLDTDLHWSQVD